MHTANTESLSSTAPRYANSHVSVQKECVSVCVKISLFWPDCTHRNHGMIRKLHTKNAWCMHLLPNSALFSIKRCTTTPVMSRNWWEHSFEGGKASAWEKGPGKGKADYFKEWMWAGGLKHADCTWQGNLQPDLSSLTEKMEMRFFITEGYFW